MNSSHILAERYKTFPVPGFPCFLMRSIRNGSNCDYKSVLPRKLPLMGQLCK